MAACAKLKKIGLIPSPAACNGFLMAGWLFACS